LDKERIMSILKIKDIILCTGLSEDIGECKKAYDWLKESGVKFQHNAYWDPDQHDELFTNYNTWGSSLIINKFPFVHYTEIDSDFNSRPVFLLGLDEIKNSNLVELFML